MLRTFRISYTDGRGLRAEERVLAFDASSAIHAFRRVYFDAADVKCEDERGEPASGGHA